MNLYKTNNKIKSQNQTKEVEVDIEYIIRLILIEVKKIQLWRLKKQNHQ